MAVVIRLKRIGAKKKPVYRVVAIDERKARSGAYLEALGLYDPSRQGSAYVDIARDRVDAWVKQGARLSDTVKSLLKKDREIKSGREAQTPISS